MRASRSTACEVPMTEWTVKLWENQEEGKFHSYTTRAEGAVLAAAEALAYFALLQDHSIITLTSHLESQLDHSRSVDQKFTVGELLHYVKEDATLLSGLRTSDRKILEMLIEELNAE
jgi:hypothetical protein